MMHATRWLPVALALVASAASLPAQDVEMLGRRYGTRPPAGYFRELARDPEAFRFTRGRAAPGRALEAAPALGAGGIVGGPAVGAPAQAMGPRGQPVVGTFRIPVLMGQFSDSPPTPLYDRATVQQTYFGAATGTVTEYYYEVSRGNLTLLGETRDWVRASMSQSAVTQNQSALECCGIGNLIKQLITLQTGVNWGAYDNDGPDGAANSGDDDGYVDALAVIHPTQGAECGGTGSANRIWSHKWSLSFGSSSHTPQATTSPRTGGGVILIDDYFVQGVVSCGGGLNEIGVFAHEAGHAFGLPDLYDTRSSLAGGVGNWDLMAMGTWGCDNVTRRPCHLGAWSKAALGWVTVTTLPSGTDLGTLVLPPVETSGTVYRVDAGDGSGEYFLLENRQRLGYDQEICEEGLLVWQVDANALMSLWPDNEVNAFDHKAVRLRQADGRDDLSRGGGQLSTRCDSTRGDAGDPFPGQSLNTAFHAGSNPASLSFAGTGTGLTIQNIAGLGTDIVFEALTRFSRLTVSSSGTTPGATGLFRVDGVALPAPPANIVLSAPFAPRTIEAAGGEVLQPGERNGFVRWSDTSEPRVRTVVTPLTDMPYVAEYGGTEYELTVALTGGVNGVTPGTIQTTPASPDLWFTSGTAVQVSAAPRTGFAFLSWTGALAGQPNPGSVVMTGPLVGGASFQMVYAVADVQLSITAAQAQDVQLLAQSGTAPLNWSVRSGSLPAGMGLSTAGRLTGVPLDVGTFPILVQAVDALGLVDSATVSLEVDEPPLPFAELASPFLLTGPALDPLEQSFLNFQGNRIGGYDLGDFRAWVLAHPTLPLSVPLAPAVEAGRTLVVPLMLRAQEAER
ncbi:MAG: M6 family metalloprotease domain-containing protein [Longimicrobiales bacterium]